MREWRARLCALASLMAIVGCASGCGTAGKAAAGVETQLRAAETSAEANPQGVGDASAKAGNLQEDELQSRKDKLLVVTFAALLQLDKKAGLAITAAEAQAMLPIVRRGEEQGEISLSDQKALDDALTAEQAKFVADFRSSVDRHRESRKELTPQEREAMIARFEEQRKREAAVADGTGAGASLGGSAALGGDGGAASVPVVGAAGGAGSGKPGGGDDAVGVGDAADSGDGKLDTGGNKDGAETSVGGDADGATGSSGGTGSGRSANVKAVATSGAAGRNDSWPPDADKLNGTSKRGGDRTIEQQLIDVLEAKLPSAGATPPSQNH